jgi:hypothetical protein
VPKSRSLAPVHVRETAASVSKARITAVHEAGHVAAAVEYGLPFDEVTIEHDDPHIPGFVVWCGTPPPGVRAAERWAVMLLAGREAERLYFAEPLPQGSDVKDLKLVREVLLNGRRRKDKSGRMVRPVYVERRDGTFVLAEQVLPERIVRLRRRARQLVRRPTVRWHIRLIRDALLAQGTLTRAQVAVTLGLPGWLLEDYAKQRR